MIRSIEIENFRGIQSGKLDDLTPLTILVGPNGCGKSTILDALLIGANQWAEDAIVYVVRRRRGLRRGDQWLLFNQRQTNEAAIKVTTSSQFTRTTTLMTEESASGGDLKIRGQVRENNESGDSIRDTNIGVPFQNGDATLHDVWGHVLEGVTEIRLVPHEIELQTPLHTLLTKAVKEGRRKEVNALIAEVVPGLYDITILTEGDSPLVFFEFDKHAIPVALAGDGVQTLLRCCLELASCPDGVVLLEEPEVHEHPGAIRQTARAILAAVRRDIQVVLSTHSLELIDALLSETQSDEELNKLSVFGMKLDDGCLKSYHLDGPEVSITRTVIEGDLR